MWTLKELQDPDMPQGLLLGNWVPVRPENYKSKNLSLWERIKRSWLVFKGDVDIFIWPEDQVFLYPTGIKKK